MQAFGDAIFLVTHDVWTLKGDLRLKQEKEGSGTMEVTFLFCSIWTLSFLTPENNSYCGSCVMARSVS